MANFRRRRSRARRDICCGWCATSKQRRRFSPEWHADRWQLEEWDD